MRVVGVLVPEAEVGVAEEEAETDVPSFGGLFDRMPVDVRSNDGFVVVDSAS